MNQYYTLRFGKYKGKPISAVPMKYLSWMLRTLTAGSGNDYLISQIKEYKKSLKRKTYRITCK